jgi:Lon-like protease
MLDPTPPSPRGPEAPALRPGPRWPYALVAVSLALGLFVALLWPVKVPYFAMSPGPVEQVTDLITIGDTDTYPIDGATYLLTVGLKEVNPFEWIEARFFDDRIDLVDRDVIRPPGVTREEHTRTNLQAMSESIDIAVYVALVRLGYDVGFTGDGVEVFRIVEGSPAEGVLEVGDRITEIGGVAVETEEDAGAHIRTFGVGDTVRLVGSRGEEPLAVEVTLVPHTQIEGAAMVGVVLTTVGLEMVLPFEVKVDSRNIGGPSAGMMYALTILDLLTEDDLVKGHRVAGTGTIRFDESIGPVGGVRQKVFAARALGVEIVFVPEANHDAALSAAGDGIVIVPVATLQDALDYLDALEPAPPRVAAAGGS